ncbi:MULTISPECIES: MFS transporter [unclassified Streptomyces]|uniref:MFS transporter n=1 Tax=unclassified Streptomyces TaxID=2593676 RepID=UPI00224EE834|nr:MULTISPECIES: MFS transporter [unclassified Streptomyces]MCX4785945.1 MFS transporter [Streptomyces sp. NBC_01221]MCX4798199.1 MFS transporter [Streptomyces sp. NBC_01242]WSP65738.1 MFS transporter [Streptomyces sp. NBC_01240]WSU26640.1 MFS transporter [Streptomyces sp. NBC_01108]
MAGSTTVRVLRDRTAGLFLAAVVVSGFGTSAMWLAAGVWVKSLTGSDSLAALAVFAMWLPVLVGPALGAIADRLPRKPLLVASNLVMAGLVASLVVVDSAGRIWILFAVLVLYGTSSVLMDAAESALVAGAVDARLLGDFNGLRMTANEGMKLLAPLTGAALYGRFGGSAVALLDAVSFALAAGVYALLPVREPVVTAPVGRRGELAAGARQVWRSPVLRPLVLAGSVTMLCAGLNGAAVYAFVDDGLGHSPTYAGVLYAAQGAGSVAVGVLAGPLLRRLPERVFTAAGIALFAVAVAARALPYDAVALAGSAAIGMGLPCVLIAAMTAVQRETPDALLGRTVATANTLMMVPNAVALALGAGLIALVDIRVLLPLVGAAALLTAALLVTGRRGRLTGAPTGPLPSSPEA